MDSKVKKMFEVEILILGTNLLQIFCKIIRSSKVIVKSIGNPGVNFYGENPQKPSMLARLLHIVMVIDLDSMASLYVFMIIQGPLYVAVAGQRFSNYLDMMLVLINIHIINSISLWSIKTESIIS